MPGESICLKGYDLGALNEMQCISSISNNSSSTENRAVNFVRSMGFLVMADGLE